MKRTLLAVALFGIAAVAMTLAGRPVLAGDDLKEHGPIAWTDSLPNAMKVAAKEKKVIFVDLWATWCGPCKQMLGTTYKDKEVVEKSKQFVPVLINIDKQAEVAKKYEIEVIPTVLFMDSKGKVLIRKSGVIEAGDFLKLMDEAKKKLKA